jgi:hypothetical protein
MQAALADEVKTGKAVYHGNAGHLLLPGGRAVFRTRIIAPKKARIGMARKRLGFTEQEAADYIDRMDDDRRKWVKYLYGVDWTDPSLYDVVINLESVAIGDACEAISTLVEAQACFQDGPKCQAALENLALASQVKARLALEPVTSQLEFIVWANQGDVTIKGKVSNLDLIAEVERIARAVPDVMQIDLKDVAPTPEV